LAARLTRHTEQALQRGGDGAERAGPWDLDELLVRMGVQRPQPQTSGEAGDAMRQALQRGHRLAFGEADVEYGIDATDHPEDLVALEPAQDLERRRQPEGLRLLQSGTAVDAPDRRRTRGCDHVC